MTDDLFRSDAYLRDCEARVVAVDEGAILLDRTVFYPLGGGQAGDSGRLLLADGREIAIADTRKAKDAEGKPTDQIVHVPAAGQDALVAALQPGDRVTAAIDWERRHKLMRFHTATHLLCHLVPQPVNGCSITADYARLDFHMTDPLDKEALTAGLARLVAAAHPLVIGAISDAELDANPALVKSMSVQPPRGTGTVRTIRIGSGEPAIDFQPCGGTHVANTGEIGAVVVTKIEKKSANSRRVVLGWGG
jgi:misacylated tRNA(Ala) deacylase